MTQKLPWYTSSRFYHPELIFEGDPECMYLQKINNGRWNLAHFQLKGVDKEVLKTIYNHSSIIIQQNFPMENVVRVLEEKREQNKVPFMDSNSSEETWTSLAVWNSSRKRLRGSTGRASGALLPTSLGPIWVSWLVVTACFLFLLVLELGCLRFFLGFRGEAWEAVAALSKPTAPMAD